MTDTTPEDPGTEPEAPTPEPTPEPEAPAPDPVECEHPELASYRTERLAKQMAVSLTRREVVSCPVGHWHVVRRTSGDEVPAPTDPTAPAPTEPPTAPTEPANTEVR